MIGKMIVQKPLLHDYKLLFLPSSVNHVKISSLNDDVENDTTTNMLINFE